MRRIVADAINLATARTAKNGNNMHRREVVKEEAKERKKRKPADSVGLKRDSQTTDRNDRKTNAIIAREAEVIHWICSYQLDRRNLTAFAKIELLEKKRAILEKQAEKRAEDGRKRGGEARHGRSPQDFGESCDPPPRKDRETNAILAKDAGVSHEQVRKATKILEAASPMNLIQFIGRSPPGSLGLK